MKPMYTEAVTFYFLPSIAQSVRFKFLEGLSKDLESAIDITIQTENPGFSVELEKSGKAKIVIWHPWKAATLYGNIDAGIAPGIITKHRKNS
jgi:hypothetical protein